MKDARLLDCDSKPETEENFARLLSMLDALTARVAALESPKTPEGGG